MVTDAVKPVEPPAETPAAEEEKGPELKGVDIYTLVTSSYFFRGANLHSAATKDDKGNDEAFPMAPALQSGITVYAPIDGVFLDIWTSMALTERETEKYNGYFQLNLPLAYKVESVTVTFTAFGLYLLNNQAETLPDVYGGVSLGATYSL